MFKIKVMYRDSDSRVQQIIHLEATCVEVDYRIKQITRHFVTSDGALAQAPIQIEEGVSAYIDGEYINFNHGPVINYGTKPGKPNTIATTDDEYRTVCVSTAHLRSEDIKALDALCETNMVMHRDTGFFVKLYEDIDHYDMSLPGAENSKYRLLSDECLTILRDAHDAGYRMVEFDSDAEKYEPYPEFW